MKEGEQSKTENRFRAASELTESGLSGIGFSPPVQFRKDEFPVASSLSSLVGKETPRFSMPVQRTKVDYKGSEVLGTATENDITFWNYITTTYSANQKDLFEAYKGIREELDSGMAKSSWDDRIIGELLNREREIAKEHTAGKKIYPGGTASNDVPDLPKAKADQWIIDMANTSNRLRVLQELCNHIISQGLFDTGVPYEELEIVRTNFNDVKNRISMVYDAGAPNAALTEYKRDNGETKMFTSMTITFSSSPFVSLSRLYSTMRHEFLHLNQYLMTPDDKTDKNDMALYELSQEWINDNLTGATNAKNRTAVKNKLSKGLIETETHIWELMNATGTGTKNDIQYISDTYHYLYDYLSNYVIAGANGMTTMAGRKRVKGHLEKCYSMVAGFLLSPAILKGSDKLTDPTFNGEDEAFARTEIGKLNTALGLIISSIT